MKTTLKIGSREYPDVVMIDSTWGIAELLRGRTRGWLCLNGTATAYVAFEDNLQDAIDTFADNDVLDTQGPLSTDDENEMWEEYPADGPGAFGYFQAGGAGEYFCGSYLHFEEIPFSAIHLVAE